MTVYGVLGGDPGTKGGLILITRDRLIKGVRFGRVGRFEAFLIVAKWAAEADLTGGLIALKENMSARPGQSTQTVMVNGRSHQYLEDLLTFNEIPYHQIDAKIWQFEFGLGGRQYHGPNWDKHKEYNERKRAQQRKAIEIFGEGITLDIADAYLIAEYAYRKTFGGLTNGKTNAPKRIGKGILWDRTTSIKQ